MSEYDWAFDLISPDRERRRRALARHRAAEADVLAAQRRLNAVWALTPHDRGQAASLRQADAQLTEARRRSFIAGGCAWRPGGDPALRTYTVLYLEWEACFPAEWHKSWLSKRWSLRYLCELDFYDDELRRRLAALVLAAANRPHRCEDAGYTPLARAVADDRLLAELRTAAGAGSIRAAFLLDFIADPAARATPAAWRRWLAATGRATA